MFWEDFMRRLVTSFLLGVVLHATSSAALQLRGIDMVFDDSTGLTWLRSGSAAAGSAFDDGGSLTDGLLTFDSARAWADQLAVPFSGSVVSDWRLPGYDVGIGTSEVQRLMLVTLGNTPGAIPTSWGPFSVLPWRFDVPFAWIGSDYAEPSPPGTFLTVQGWLVREPVHVWPPRLAWAYGLGSPTNFPGIAELASTSGLSYQQQGLAWAVRTGDVALIPEASTAAMFLAGLVALLFAASSARRRSA